MDDILLKKYHSSKIEGTSDLKDHKDGAYGKSQILVTFALTNNINNIPINHFFWVSKEYCLENEYKTKN